MPTVAEVKSYLRINFDDDDTMLASLILVANEWLKGAVGKDYDNTSERAKMLSLIVISDLYDNRGMTDKLGGTTRRLVSDFALQLKLETVVI